MCCLLGKVCVTGSRGEVKERGKGGPKGSAAGSGGFSMKKNAVWAPQQKAVG